MSGIAEAVAVPQGGMANPCRRKLSERPVRREKLIKLKKRKR
jgi:hypothetical protein